MRYVVLHRDGARYLTTECAARRRRTAVPLWAADARRAVAFTDRATADSFALQFGGTVEIARSESTPLL